MNAIIHIAALVILIAAGLVIFFLAVFLPMLASLQNEITQERRTIRTQDRDVSEPTQKEG